MSEQWIQGQVYVLHASRLDYKWSQSSSSSSSLCFLWMGLMIYWKYLVIKRMVLDPINDGLIGTVWTAHDAEIHTVKPGDWSGHLCCKSWPWEGHWGPYLSWIRWGLWCWYAWSGLGLLVTEPTLSHGTVILSTEVDAFFC